MGNEHVEPHDVAYMEWNPDGQKTIVCVHGLTRNARDFEVLANQLVKDGYRVLSFDMPGRGKSQWLEDAGSYNYGTYVTDMIYIIGSMKLAGCDYLGTSMGGLIGMMLASTYPGIISRLIINDVGPFISRESLIKLVDDLTLMPKEYSTKEKAMKAMKKQYASFGFTKDEHWDHFIEHSLVEKENGEGVRHQFDPKILEAISAKGIKDHFDLWAMWPNVLCPVLLIHGEESPVLTKEIAKTMADSHPELTLKTLKGVGHAPSLYSDEEIAMIRAWLNEKKG